MSRSEWSVLLVLCGAVFLEGIDVSMVGVALPAIRSDMAMSTGALQWVVSAYVLGYGGFVLLGGRAADCSDGGGCSCSGSPCSWSSRVSAALRPRAGC